MMTIIISQHDINYIAFSCPECGESDFLMNNFVCSYCNTILPNIQAIPIDIEERVWVYKETIITGV